MIKRLKVLLAGDAETLAAWTRAADPRWIWTCVWVFSLSCAVYGATFGLWRIGIQAVFTAVKFPLVVLLTAAGNVLLNGSLALVLGAGLGLRQSVTAILMSFVVMGLVLAAFAPVMVFLWWNVPGFADADALTGKRITLLAHVGVIATAGVVGNHHLWRLLRHLTGSAGRANAVLGSWLAGNLLLGSQISWILRPWLGRPGVPERFFSPDPLWGNFFESVWRTFRTLVDL